MVDSFIKYLSYERRFSQHTVIAYENDLIQLQDYLSETFEIDQLEDVEHAHLRGWVVHLMDAGMSPRSVNRKIVSVKSFYKFLQKREVLESNPATRLKSLRVPRDLPQFVKENEMTDLLDQLAFAEDFSGQRDKLMLSLLYATGMRLAELISLRDDSLNRYESTLKVLGKRNKERIIPLHREVLQLISHYQSLRDQVEKRASDKLLITDSGNDLYPQFVYNTVKRYLTEVTTLSKRSPHVLRHTFATHLLNKGADLNAVKDLLGHASLASTQVYTHNSIEKLKAVFDQAHPKA